MFRINDVVKYNGVNCTIIDIRDENGSVLYDLREVDGDGEYNDVKELNKETEHIIFDSVMESIDGEDVCDSWFDDERINLNEDLGRKIIAIADLGLWSGHKTGYKLLGTNLNNILDFFGCDDVKVYDNETDVCATATHHDGTNYITFRLVKDDVDIDELTDKIYAGTHTQEDIEKYTVSLSPFVQEIYGW